MKVFVFQLSCSILLLALTPGIITNLQAQSDPSATANDELLIDRYKWKVVKGDSGSWLVLVAPVSSVSKSSLKGTLTLLISKRYDNDQRAKINFVFDKMLNNQELVRLEFYQDDKNDPLQTISLAVTSNDKTKSLSAITSKNGYVTDRSTGQQTDLLQSFLQSDILVAEFWIKRTKMKSLIPIKWFRKQYTDLER
jgi:hypothetical protein